MGDILSAASLLFAVSGILYGFWYPEISEALNLKVEGFKVDNVIKLSKITLAFRKAFILGVASFIFVLIFLPIFLKIVALSYVNIQENGCKAYYNYDPIQASLIFVLTCSLVIGVHLLVLSYELIKKKRTKLKE
jgi:hypothetical protein